MCQMTFERYEKKYRLTRTQQEKLLRRLDGEFVPDVYGNYLITNLYYDSEDDVLIRTSLDKPVYKEKLRMRAYGVPKADDTVFVEIKKKYRGVVYKRRISRKESEAVSFLRTGEYPGERDQIAEEIRWMNSRYALRPRAYISYRRLAFAGAADPQLRLTFDTEILARAEQLDLKKGSFGTPLLGEDEVLMEIKIPGAYPLWLQRILEEEGLSQTSFSKYGTWYQMCEKERQRLAEDPHKIYYLNDYTFRNGRADEARRKGAKIWTA
ncbi:MAG: polyphosphate polymerase domain-containing protein [Lachnospiraceae bacterium]|nr:polyphosphate polymerase domain-containing protein [Lachnospiraceae bacterium]